MWGEIGYVLIFDFDYNVVVNNEIYQVWGFCCRYMDNV